ncbi:outer membrane lipid asymmetry maintenance protein MlaD [Utexia brackfieldae]|uniref:outer membrane lipid asymmetry maintenance protein MlaD n=1 Tax=Utexia brackfieldae TaxID=3074108 RepID=UPI00370D5A51
MENRKIEITVGLFMLIVIASLLFICFKVTDTASIRQGSSYRVYAVFDNIGGLKARSPIKVGGVVIGRVSDVVLTNTDGEGYKPYVTMDIDSRYNQIPSSSALSIKTSGLLGEQFIAIDLGVKRSVIDEIDELDAPDTGDMQADNNQTKTPEYFEAGFVIHNTKPALVLEDLIGQFLYKSDSSTATPAEESH